MTSYFDLTDKEKIEIIEKAAKASNKAQAELVKKEEKINELFDKDMRWTRIHEMIKMRALITPEDKDYYFEKLK